MKITLVLHKYAVPLNDPCCYALGYMYVSSVLKELGHEVKVLNYNLWDYDLKEEIKGQDLVGFTGFEEFLPYIKRDAAVCTERGVRTILGGALATFLPEVMLRHVSVVVQGEAENVLEYGLSESGIAFWGTPPFLSNLPLPDYEGFGIEEYHKRHGHRYMGVLTSRGCPYHCTFCSQTCKFQLRKLSDVFKEIDLYKKKYRIEQVVFNDNTINVNRGRFLALCKGMRGKGLSWGAAIRADVWDEEMTLKAKDSGMGYVIVGVESFNQERLDRMNKKIKVEQIIRTLDLLEKHGIEYSGNVLVGFEYDTYADVSIEVQSIPDGYKIFPVLVQPFIGTKNAKTRKLSEEEYGFLFQSFREYIEEKGKYLYPEIPAGGVQ